MESWEPSEHSIIDRHRETKKICAEVAGRRTFRILTCSPAARQLKYVGAAIHTQYYNTHEITTIDTRHNTIHTGPTNVRNNAHRKSNTK